MTLVDFVVADVSGHADLNALPGGSVLQQLVNGLMAWGLYIALAGLLVGAAVWVWSSKSGQVNQGATAHRAVGIACAAAVLIGAGPTLVNFFLHLGQQVR